LAASIFSIRLMMSWGGFGVYSALITSGLAGMVQWFILAGSLGLLMGILS